MATPIDAGLFCSFSVSDPGGDWISAIHIEDQDENVLLDVSYASYAENGYRDATDNIIACHPGDILKISVTVDADSSSWTQSLSWGHSIYSEDLETVADLHSLNGCPWTHIYYFEVPDNPGVFLVSWWEHYDGYDSGCGTYTYAERQDYTLWIIDLSVPATAETWQDFSPSAYKPPPAVEASRNILVVSLQADGLDAVLVPAASIQIRFRHVSASYVQVGVTDPLSYASQIVPRLDGRMYIFTGYETSSGATWLEELIYANIQNMYFTRSNRGSLTLTGTRYITFSDPQARNLDNIFKLRIDGGGKHKVRCAYDNNIRPRDTVTLPDGRSFIVGFMSVFLSGDTAWMNVEE